MFAVGGLQKSGNFRQPATCRLRTVPSHCLVKLKHLFFWILHIQNRGGYIWYPQRGDNIRRKQ